MDVKEAVRKAKDFAVANLGGLPTDYSFEEMELDTYKRREVWAITLGMPKKPPAATASTRSPMQDLFRAPDREYKTFLIARDTGDVLAMKVRVLAGS